MNLKPLLKLHTRYLFLALGVVIFLMPLAFQSRIVHADSPSYVRVIHASPDVGTADVFVDGSRLLSNFQFGTVTGYASIAPGPHKVQVGLIGKGPNAAMITQTISVEAGSVYTVAALGTEAKGFLLKVFNDDNQVMTGMTKVRIYNLSPDTDLNSVKTNNNTLASGLSYQDASNYLALEAGSYTFTINTAQDNAPIPFSAKLDQNTVTSVFAIGETSGTPKLQFISTKADGVPGMPGTGSDPNAADPEAFQIQPVWFLGILIVGVVVAMGIGLGKFARVRRA
jgi:Domain of unknown function (DUF4397)